MTFQTAWSKHCTLWLKTTKILHTIPTSLTRVKVVSKKSFSRKLNVQIRVNFFELERKRRKNKNINTVLPVITPLGYMINYVRLN